ncbi:5-formyltetrahydrofolate cyclo-ligase [Campylobacter sp. FMV-PI01]|uniref:5-formyltetrahydrofolate cyclo-ligase n=1 Tax=Campylobacter portucalensis TaxID=2608384 RepID=A0A6L5WIH1_9BACT|nr:5-formyltetrahydrofolate cyclo-ligase [Campylobacter portucalensis]MSN95825.1 5-formyltetrahydrofolate cyclo-ligase [Campylobacter portucalensis]
MDSITKEKFRKIAKISLKKEVKISAKCRHYAILLNLKEIIKITNSKDILFFVPTKYEPDLLLLRRNLSKKHHIFIPFMQNLSFKMVKLKLPFYKFRFGIRQNKFKNEFKKRLDLAVVPVIGVDGKMARIGHGKGFYDRFFSGLKYKPIVVFVEIKDMFIKDIISENHDVRCDFYLTPSKNYLIRGKYDRNFNRLRSRCSGSWHRIRCN